MTGVQTCALPISWQDFPEMRYQINNGITLCHFHHPKTRKEEKRLIPALLGLVSVSNENTLEINKPSNFVKADVNVKHGDTLELLTEGYWDKMTGADGKTKEVLKFDAKLPNGEVKIYSMNNSTIDNMTAAYGKNSKNWMNKPLKVWIEMEMSFGKRKPVLRLTPIDWTASMMDGAAVPTIDEDESDFSNIPV